MGEFQLLNKNKRCGSGGFIKGRQQVNNGQFIIDHWMCILVLLLPFLNQVSDFVRAFVHKVYIRDLQI